uniref:Interleukin-13 n=1 Tax=Marmota marmota marmota TaxID=9994 RepID=A0A8C5ZNG0_MARMA
MALWLTVVLTLACLSGLAAPGPVPPPSPAFRELIEELVNITQDQKVSMDWPAAGGLTCHSLDSLIKVSNCSAIQKTQRMLSGLCTHKNTASTMPIPDTKIEVGQFVKKLLSHLRCLLRHGKLP